MRYALTVLDDFLPEPDALTLRDTACAADYAPFYGVDGAAVNPVRRVARLRLPSVVAALGAALGRSVTPIYSGFRIDYEGERPNTLVHYDGECARWAVVYYLNPPDQCQGGTAFWRHRDTGLNAVPANATPDIEAAFRSDGMQDRHWHIESIVGMRWNRCLIYPTSAFHSRWPFEGFGTTPQDGRLVCGMFFDFYGENR